MVEAQNHRVVGLLSLGVKTRRCGAILYASAALRAASFLVGFGWSRSICRERQTNSGLSGFRGLSMGNGSLLEGEK